MFWSFNPGELMANLPLPLSMKELETVYDEIRGCLVVTVAAI
jgi:hypothetical protein